jgi:hypothetical protein
VEEGGGRFVLCHGAYALLMLTSALASPSHAPPSPFCAVQPSSNPSRSRLLDSATRVRVAKETSEEEKKQQRVAKALFAAAEGRYEKDMEFDDGADEEADRELMNALTRLTTPLPKERPKVRSRPVAFGEQE